MDGIVEQFLAILQEYCQREFNGNVSAMSRFFGGEPSSGLMQKWFKGERRPNMTSLAPIFDRLGAKIVLPEGSNKEVCFINAKVVPAGELAESPNAEDYLAAPLVGEAGAGPGYLPQEAIKSWFLVYKHQAAVRYRRNLIAVELGPDSISMKPTLNPGDIVLVDRDDRDVSTPGKIMLVLDPDGSGAIKRVMVTEDGNDFQIHFYSDNTIAAPPHTYSLRKDFGNDMEKAIIGRVVWAWADMNNR